MATAKRGGLGKGLGALIGSTAIDAEPESTDAEAVPPPIAESGPALLLLNPRDLRPNPKQPRHHFDEDALQELAQSIVQDGVQEPVIVRQRDGHYELVSGERRVRASILADLTEIPAICRDVSDDDMLKLGLIENIQREDLNPIETARAYQGLLDHFDWKQDELAQQVGKKRATITNMLRLLNLPDEVQDMVMAGEISMGHARAILAVESPSHQLSVARKAAREGLSVREIERLASGGTKSSTKKSTGGTTRKDPHLAELEDELRRTLGTKVHLTADANGRGKIELEFYSLDDLDRLLDILRRR